MFGPKKDVRLFFHRLVVVVDIEGHLRAIREQKEMSKLVFALDSPQITRDEALDAFVVGI